MHGDQVSASFRSLVEKCLKRAMAQNVAGSEAVLSGENGFAQGVTAESATPEIRTEINLKVLQEFLKN